MTTHKHISFVVAALVLGASPARGADQPTGAHAEAGALVARGETAVRAGQPAEAWKLFSEAWRVDHASATAVRWICRLALTFGPHEAATGACREAFILGRQPEDMRNRVAAWVRSETPPTMEELVSASFMADGAVRTAPKEPWGYLAWADLALRLRDHELLTASVAELTRVAPEHPQVRRMMALTAPHATNAVWIARWLVVLLVGLTALHAAWSRWWRAPRRLLVVATALLVFVGGAGAAVARPANVEAAASPLVPPPLPPVDDQHIEESLAKADAVNPLVFGDALMVTIDRAQKATERGDHATAARYWTAVTRAVPDRSYGFARLCEAREAAGDLAAAVEACRAAITHDGSTVRDYTRFVRLLLAKAGRLTVDDRRQIGVAIGALAKEPKAAADGAELECELALRDGDFTALRTATAKLVAAAPDSPNTAFYRWTLAFEARDRRAADGLVGEARARGVKADVVARMKAATLGLPLSAPERALGWGLAGAGVFALARVARRVAARWGARSHVIGEEPDRVF
jgi:hypothetical protein